MTDQERAAMQQALEALEDVDGPITALLGGLLGSPDADAPGAKVRTAITALRAALTQKQAEPKPLHPEVRKMCEEYFDKCVEALLTFPVAPLKAQDPTPPPEDVTEAEPTVKESLQVASEPVPQPGVWMHPWPPVQAQEPEPPPEAVTEAEKTAYAAGWWAAMARRPAHD